ncbi:MAG: efflux RND transporter periplasmic adaptor subunit [Xanthomonadales bacterium]|nr:efflux RND transporter periplasmic adaptor subunit [Xanthomonadales bacterium]
MATQSHKKQDGKPSVTKRMIVMLLIAGVIFGGVFGWKWFSSMMMNQYFDNMPAPTVAVSATQAERDSWPREIRAVGSFKATNGVNLTTELGGIVRSLEFENGAYVEAGEVLARLDVDADEAQLAALRAARDLAESERDRLRRLRRQNSVSESELDQAESRFRQAAAEVDAQQARIDQKILRAPFDGYLGIRRVDLGEYIAPGTPIVPLRAIAPIFMNFTLPERHLPNVETGARVTVTTDAWPNEPFEGVVTSVEGSMNEQTRSFLVQATFENADMRLRPGMFASAVVRWGEPRDVLMVPQTAVSFNPYGNSVYVIGGEEGDLSVERRLVQTGERRGDMVAVTDGLEAGDRVATSGLLKLSNGTSVEINNEIRPESDLDPQPADG